MVVRDVQGRKGPLAFEIAFFSHTRKLVPSELAGAGRGRRDGRFRDFEISRSADSFQLGVVVVCCSAYST